jgi:hypothetical protein
MVNNANQPNDDEMESLEITSFQDLALEYINEEKLLQSQVYVEDGHLIIDAGYEYAIELNRCNTNDKILGWVNQLSEKTWMTFPMLRRFIHLAQSTNGLLESHCPA